MTLPEVENMIDVLCKTYPKGFNLEMAREHSDKLEQKCNLKLFADTCNQMVAEQAMSYRKDRDGKPILIPLGKQSAAARNLNQDEQRIYNMIRETKGMGKLMFHLGQETKGQKIHQRLKKIVEKLVYLKLIRKIQSVKYGKKVLYIDTSVKPDDCHSGGAWYNESNQEFDGEFVKYVKEFALRKLQSQKSEAEKKYKNHPLLQLKCSKVTASDVIKYFEELSVEGTKLFKDCNFSVKDIDAILNTFCLTGQAECKTYTNKAGVEIKEYMLVNSFLDEEHGSVITQTPCGLCSLTDQCGVGNVVSPLTCPYMKDTFDGLDYLDW